MPLSLSLSPLSWKLLEDLQDGLEDGVGRHRKVLDLSNNLFRSLVRARFPTSAEIMRELGRRHHFRQTSESSEHFQLGLTSDTHMQMPTCDDATPPPSPSALFNSNSDNSSKATFGRRRKRIRRAADAKRTKTARRSEADDDDDDFQPTGDSESDNNDSEDVDEEEEEKEAGKTRARPSVTSTSAREKREAQKAKRSCQDDGCAATFATRLADFKRAVERSVREASTSFYNKPPRELTLRGKRQRSTQEEAASDAVDELSDGDFHDEVVADEATEAPVEAAATAVESYSPTDVVETDSGLTVPTYMYAHLFPHQQECLEWLHHLHERNTGGILGDEMGLGKTVQIAAFLGAMHHARRVRSVLLLCPASVLLQWVREFHKWYPPMRVVLLHASGSGVTQAGRTYAELIQEVLFDGGGGNDNDSENDSENDDRGRGGGVVIATYENVRQYQELFMDHEWDYVVLDEGHRIRNPDAEITLVCKQFKTVHRIILTGTPIQNRLRELWSLFDFVYPGKLGTLPTFDDEFVLPIRTGGYANASRMQVLMAYKCALVLKDLITPFLLRRTKKEIQHVTRMPDKMEQILFCSLTPRQRSVYQRFLGSAEVASVLRRDVRPFRAIAILRHICNHPDLLETVGENGAGALPSQRSDLEDYGSVENSGKMLVLTKILSLWKEQGHRVLLFTQTRKMLDILESTMARLGYRSCRLDGTTSVKKRQSLLDAFNADDSKIFVFLLTTRAGGIGINLTGADRVVIFDPDWNPSTDLQARERSWRLGQTKPVTIYRLITSGTIEEKIYHRQIFKQYLTTKVLHDAKRKRCFNKHTLQDLFVLGAEGDQGTETNDIFIAGNVENPTAKSDRVAGEDDDEGKEDGEDDGADGDSEEVEGGGNSDDSDDAVDRKAGKKASSGSDNDAILKKLFDGVGIRGVFNHDAVESDGIQNQEADLVDMESTKIAKSALSALRASCVLVRQQRESLFTPTWTGRSGVAGDPSQQRVRRFGSRVARGRQPLASGAAASRNTSSSSGSRLTQSAGRGASSRRPFEQTPLSSTDMLSKIKMRRNGVAPAVAGRNHHLKNGFMTVDEMTKQLHAFLTPSTTDPQRHSGGVTTEAIIEAFASVIAPKDKLVFRNLLRDMADCRGRKWTLKQEFETVG